MTRRISEATMATAEECYLDRDKILAEIIEIEIVSKKMAGYPHILEDGGKDQERFFLFCENRYGYFNKHYFDEEVIYLRNMFISLKEKLEGKLGECQPHTAKVICEMLQKMPYDQLSFLSAECLAGMLRKIRLNNISHTEETRKIFERLPHPKDTPWTPEVICEALQKSKPVVR